MIKYIVFIVIYIVLSSSAIAFEDMKDIKKRAKSGDADAQVYLGMRYIDGDGWRAIPPTNMFGMYIADTSLKSDFKKGLYWINKGAMQNHVKGQIFLGDIYVCSYGVEFDMDAAKKWYKLACENGSNTGCKRLENVSSIDINRFCSTM